VEDYPQWRISLGLIPTTKAKHNAIYQHEIKALKKEEEEEEKKRKDRVKLQFVKTRKDVKYQHLIIQELQPKTGFYYYYFFKNPKQPSCV
jgi:hypothetical protein